MEEQYRKEKEELRIQFQRQTREYETRIETLQKQVDLAQSMISSTCSHVTWESERILGYESEIGWNRICFALLM